MGRNTQLNEKHSGVCYVIAMCAHCINTVMCMGNEKIFNYSTDIEKNNAFSVTLMSFCACVWLLKHNMQPCEHGERPSVEMAS